MNTREMLEKYKDQVIKLSFGSGFVFCGKVEEGMDALLKRADEYYIDQARRSKWAAQKSLRKAEALLKVLPGEIKAKEKELDDLQNDLVRAKAEIDKEEDKVIQREMRKGINEIKDRIKELDGDKRNVGEISLLKKKYYYYERRIPILKRTIKNISRYIEEYTPFIDRNVKEEYHSIDHSDICEIDMIVICDGVESGDYWTVKEYREDKERRY